MTLDDITANRDIMLAPAPSPKVTQYLMLEKIKFRTYSGFTLRNNL